MPVEKIGTALEGAKAVGICNIVALRGDPPKGQEQWAATEGGFNCALDLVRHIRKEYGTQFCVSVAGYPEGHPNVIKKVEEGQKLTASEKLRLVTMTDGDYVCNDADYAGELAYLKEKVDAGAEVIITQMFFDSAVFLQFVKDCRGAGINVPIVPGIMLIQNYAGFNRMIAFCKSRVPTEVRTALDEVKDDDAQVKAVGTRLAVQLCRDLLEAGTPGLHFYTLNTEEATFAVLEALGLKK
jgi:methylenetetrahydrofolate reductase (NADPH)